MDGPLTGERWLLASRSLSSEAHQEQRRINQRQVMECLRRGRICEPAHLAVHGDWVATLEHRYAGDMVRVVAAIERQEDGELAVVVTVMN